MKEKIVSVFCAELGFKDQECSCTAGNFASPALGLSALKPTGKPLPASLHRLLPKSTMTLAETQQAHVGSGQRALPAELPIRAGSG